MTQTVSPAAAEIKAIFDRIAAGDETGGAKLFSAEASNSYSEQIGMSVDTPQVQNMVDRMITANLILRKSHGVYAVADPFVRQAWQLRKNLHLPGTPLQKKST